MGSSDALAELIGYFFIGVYYLVILLICINLYSNRKSLKSILIYSALLVCLIVIGLFLHGNKKEERDKAAKDFLGYWKIEKLNGSDCLNCKIKLNSDYHYDIIVKNKIIGHGDWHVETGGDVVGYYLRIDTDESSGVIWSDPKVLYNLNTSSN